MPPSKGFLCVLELQIRSITCPGVTLKAKDDLYISARILGQNKKTSSVRAIFPLLFNEKLIFEKPIQSDRIHWHVLLYCPLYHDSQKKLIEPLLGKLPDHSEEAYVKYLLSDKDLEITKPVAKFCFIATRVYTDAVDPGDLVELFERDTAVLELIQTVPPVGEILATYEENTRDFLFPAPKSITGQRGSVREILMKKAYGFTGIAPKLKFFTSCLISENLLHSGKAEKQDNVDQQHRSSKEGTPQIRSPKKNSASLERNRQCLAAKTYDQPTVASLSRSPSPYTKRRMCELQQLRQRLAHLDLGPFDFRKESDRPPFVIRRPEQLSPSPDVFTWCRPKEDIKDAWPETTYDPTLLGSYRPKNRKQTTRSHSVKDLDGFSHSYDKHLTSSIAGRQLYSTHLLMHSAPPQLQKYYSTPMLNRLSLRERFRSGWSATVNGEEIHKRVRNILRTHSARQRLTFDESCLSKDDSAKTRDSSKTEESTKKRDISDRDCLSNSDLQSSSSVRQSIMVQLDNDDFWTTQAAEYKSKPHRAIFEDSLEKIYRNMYRKASGSISKNK